VKERQKAYTKTHGGGYAVPMQDVQGAACVDKDRALPGIPDRSLDRAQTDSVRLDSYNLLNANPILTQNNTYGAAWQNVTMFVKGRLMKVGAQIAF